MHRNVYVHLHRNVQLRTKREGYRDAIISHIRGNKETKIKTHVFDLPFAPPLPLPLPLPIPPLLPLPPSWRGPLFLGLLLVTVSEGASSSCMAAGPPFRRMACLTRKVRLRIKPSNVETRLFGDQASTKYLPCTSTTFSFIDASP